MEQLLDILKEAFSKLADLRRKTECLRVRRNCDHALEVIQDLEDEIEGILLR